MGEKTKAYVPFGGTPKIQSTSQLSVRVPDYPDAGVKYAGYYRVLNADGTYQLKTQEPYNTRILVTGGTPQSNPIADGKILYITDVWAVAYGTNAGNLFWYFGDSTEYKVTGWYPVTTSAPHNNYIHFSVPIALKGEVVYDCDVGAIVEFNVVGWFE